jgi:hypothetical protein
MTRDQKLERWANRELPRHVDNMILEQDGQILAFGRYLLETSRDCCTVSMDNRTVHVFANRRTAISWCTAHKLRQGRLTEEIKNLDQLKQDLTADIQQRQKQAQRSNRTEFRDLVAVKLQPKQARLTVTVTELEKCIKLAKYLQLKGFNNETLRTSSA